MESPVIPLFQYLSPSRAERLGLSLAKEHSPGGHHRTNLPPGVRGSLQRWSRGATLPAAHARADVRIP